MHVTGRDLDPGPVAVCTTRAPAGQVGGGALHRGGADAVGPDLAADGDQALPVGGQHRTRPAGAQLGVAAQEPPSPGGQQVARSTGAPAARLTLVARPATSGRKSPAPWAAALTPMPSTAASRSLPGGPRPGPAALRPPPGRWATSARPGRPGRPRRPPGQGGPGGGHRQPDRLPGDRGPQHHRDQQRAARRGHQTRQGGPGPRSAPRPPPWPLGLAGRGGSAALAIVVGTFATTSRAATSGAGPAASRGFHDGRSLPPTMPETARGWEGTARWRHSSPRP